MTTTPEATEAARLALEAIRREISNDDGDKPLTLFDLYQLLGRVLCGECLASRAHTPAPEGSVVTTTCDHAWGVAGGGRYRCIKCGGWNVGADYAPPALEAPAERVEAVSVAAVKDPCAYCGKELRFPHSCNWPSRAVPVTGEAIPVRKPAPSRVEAKRCECEKRLRPGMVFGANPGGKCPVCGGYSGAVIPASARVEAADVPPECDHIRPCCGNYERCDLMCIHRAGHWQTRAEAAESALSTARDNAHAEQRAADVKWLRNEATNFADDYGVSDVRVDSTIRLADALERTTSRSTPSPVAESALAGFERLVASSPLWFKHAQWMAGVVNRMFAERNAGVVATLTIKRRKDEQFPIWVASDHTGAPGIGFTQADADHLGFTRALGDAKKAVFDLRTALGDDK